MYLVELKPITGDEKRLPEIYGVADIEASDWVGFLTIGRFSKYDGEFKHFEKMEDFLEHSFSYKNDVSIFYCHNGGRYDFLFLLEAVVKRKNKKYVVHDMIPRGSSLLSLRISQLEKAYKEGSKWFCEETGHEINKNQWHDESKGIYRFKTIEFRDSTAILPFSLDSLCKNFDVSYKKRKIDYEKIQKVTPELIEYLEHDCRGLYEVIEKYRNWPLIQKAGTAQTMASQSLKVFRTFLRKPIRSLNSSVDEFVRQSYFGGRTEIFKPLFMGNQKNTLKCYDVNSLYPTIMRDNDFPVGFLTTMNEYDPKMMGFWHVFVHVPENLYIPPLGTVMTVNGTKKFIFPVGKFEGVWTTAELEYAKKFGVKILWCKKGHVFENGGPIFKDFIENLYKIRLSAKPKSVDDILAKLLMNSCYGRFGIKRQRESVEFDQGQQDISPIASLNFGKNEIIRLVKKPKFLDKTFSHVGIASWVTSHARIYIHKQFVKYQSGLYYGDTDSAFIREKIPTGSNLGEMKFEYEVDGACFLLPKTYMVTSFDKIFKKSNGLTSDRKVVMKGFTNDVVSNMPWDDFLGAFEGEIRLLQALEKGQSLKKMKKILKSEPLLSVFMPAKGIETMKTAIRKDTFLVKRESSEKKIMALYDKRQIYKTRSGDFDTKPLLIENGKIEYLNKITKFDIDELVD